ncbi:hypothetical protein LTR66_011896 [Elasticomyces elasticus]|nr:hypothetical protein LTR66_011896 [Elasticomyces elasticus]KAK4985597.1 hypothetical protein LTR50_005862 [Elasticomyces elasticus]
MGTLTADTPRLAEYCAHKLPASCRLTSITECCACADERAHSSSYSTYIDGVGFVMRGTRWQRYCWFCKEFWENRIATTNLRPAQTRIPEVPDQTEFLERWYEFHRGYRIVRREDGTEERVAVLGEPFKDVSPGHLPRTLDELRAGRDRSAAEALIQHVHLEEEAADEGPSLEETLDSMINAASAEDAANTAAPRQTRVRQEQPILETAPTARRGSHARGPIPNRSREYQQQRLAALRRELHRLRNGIERVIAILADLRDVIPYSLETTASLETIGRSLGSIEGSYEREAVGPNDPSTYVQTHGLATLQIRINCARAQLDEARHAREAAADELHASEAEVRAAREQVTQLEREQRTAENYALLFGTREEMEQAGADYESPIGGMFTRAGERYRVAEEVRREERGARHLEEEEQRIARQANQLQEQISADAEDGVGTVQPTDDSEAAVETETTIASDDPLHDYHGFLGSPVSMHDAQQALQTGNFPSNMLTAIHAEREQQTAARNRLVRRMAGASRLDDPAERSAAIRRMIYAAAYPPESNDDEYDDDEDDGSDDSDVSDNEAKGLDAPASGRPEPKPDEEMEVKLDCKVCYTQLADTAVLPCGHLVMCTWCADQYIPCFEHDRTRPVRPTNCAMCRKKVKQKVRLAP